MEKRQDYWEWMKQNFLLDSPHNLAAEWTAPGRPADHEEGICYEAPWEEPFGGFSIHSRKCAIALARTGFLPLHLRSTPGRALKYASVEFEDVQAQVGSLLNTSCARYVVQIHQLVPHEGTLQLLTSPPRLFWGTAMSKTRMAARNLRKIAYTVWERSTIPTIDAEALSRVGEAWVACEANAETLRRQGVERVRVIRVPHDPDDEPLILHRKRARIPGPCRFYHIGKWEPRKDQHTMVGAFLRAFLPTEAQLLVKTSPYAGGVRPLRGYPPDFHTSVSQWLQDAAVRANGWDEKRIASRVLFNSASVTPEQIQEQHALGDVYVSPSHGEGFDLPAYEATLAGNLLLTTESGGPLSFLHTGSVVVPSSGEVPCHPWYRWHDSKWSDYDIDALAAGFRSSLEQWKAIPPRESRSHRDMSAFTYDAVGDEMVAGIRAVIGR